MEYNNQNQESQFHEEEIDIIAILKRLWEKRTFIIKVACVFVALGVFVAIFTPNEYTASCVVVPETKTGAFSSSSLGGLAAMAGINLEAASGGEMLSPLMYDKLLKNINLRKELMQTPIMLEDYEEPVTILDYYTNPVYKKSSFFGTVKKYTIGLPGVIFAAFKDEETEPENKVSGAVGGLSSYTQEELECIKVFAPLFSVLADKKNGDVTISARMPEALAAAQVVEAIKDLLQKYVIEMKLQKAEINYDYIKQRYDEARTVFEQKQEAYAKFQDANKVLSTALVKAKEEQLKSEFDVAKDLFNQLTTQLIQAEMKIKEDIPVLTVIEPVQVPFEKSAPKRAKIVVVWLLMGIIFSGGFVVLNDWLKGSGFRKDSKIKAL